MTSEDQQAQAPTHSEQGLFSTRLSQKLIGKPPKSDLPNVEQNGLRFSTPFGFQHHGDQDISAETAPAVVLAMAARATRIAPLLVPVRESGSVVPPAGPPPWVPARSRRLPILLLGTLGQALGCIIAMCAA